MHFGNKNPQAICKVAKIIGICLSLCDEPDKKRDKRRKGLILLQIYEISR